MSPWIFLRFLFLPAVVIAGNQLGGWWNFSIPVICFVIHPLVIFFSKQAPSDHHDEDPNPQHNAKAYRLIPLLFVPVMTGLTGWAVIQSNTITIVEFAGLALSIGVINGVLGFTLAHEFIHRHSRLEKIAGHLLLLQNNHMYYAIEHIRGHHVYACTQKDPHTARIGESIYQFLPRAISATFLNAWEIESIRLHRKKICVISIHNQMLLFILLQISLYAMVIIFAGWIPFLFFILESLIAILLLNAIGYLQHYGLARIEVIPGRFEKISAHHAWNCNKGNNKLNLFQLEKHADHHMHPGHSYEQLVRHQESPEQPTGYSGMMWLALVPPLWFRIMNNRISSFTNKIVQHETAY